MLDSFLFPQVSDLELKEYFKKESKLTPQQIDKLIECIGGSNLLAMEIILKGKNFEGKKIQKKKKRIEINFEIFLFQFMILQRCDQCRIGICKILAL